jgi:putative membrane protein
MHNGYFGNGMDSGWEWIPMMTMMIVFLGGILWLGIIVVRRTGPAPSTTPVAPVAPAAPAAPASPASRTPQEILAERLATGQIDPDDYQVRLRTLQGQPDR